MRRTLDCALRPAAGRGGRVRLAAARATRAPRRLARRRRDRARAAPGAAAAALDARRRRAPRVASSSTPRCGSPSSTRGRSTGATTSSGRSAPRFVERVPRLLRGRASPFDPRLHVDMHGVILLAIFAVVLCVGLAVAARAARPRGARRCSSGRLAADAPARPRRPRPRRVLLAAARPARVAAPPPCPRRRVLAGLGVGAFVVVAALAASTRRRSRRASSSAGRAGTRTTGRRSRSASSTSGTRTTPGSTSRRR